MEGKSGTVKNQREENIDSHIKIKQITNQGNLIDYDYIAPLW
jgi:hypothetical protein